MKKVSNIVADLLSIAPQMAFIPDQKNRYPLHIAIQNRQSLAVIQSLFLAYPELRRMCDPVTHLLPFMQAAVGTWRHENEQLDVIYQLLSEDPTLVNGI